MAEIIELIECLSIPDRRREWNRKRKTCIKSAGKKRSSPSGQEIEHKKLAPQLSVIDCFIFLQGKGVLLLPLLFPSSCYLICVCVPGF